jgi:hypothetical protein
MAQNTLARFRDRSNTVEVTAALERVLPVLTLVSAFGLLWILAARMLGVHGTPIVDDAYIALIYARSLAEGSGLAFTDGSRVEGYTDFLWVALAAGAIRLHVDPVSFVQAASFVSALALVAAVWSCSQRYTEAPPYLRFAPLLLASSSALAFWALAGLETTLFALLLFVATMIAGRARSAGWFAVAGALYAAAALAHPDAVIWLAVSAAYLAARRQPRSLFTMVALFAVPFAVYWVCRWAYFGDFWPNTVHAKDTASLHQIGQGIAYLRAAALVPLLSLPIVAAAFATTRMRRRGELVLLFMQLAVWAAYVVYVGGDALLANRFWVPVLAPGCILIQESVASLWPQSGGWSRRVALAGFVAVLFALALQRNFAGHELQRIQYEGWVDGRRVDMGRWFANNSAPDDVIATNAAGAIPYLADRPAIDMLGLNDRHIAREGAVEDAAPIGHKKSDAGYVLDRQPEFIVLSLLEFRLPLRPQPSQLPSIRDLLSDTRLSDGYVRLNIPGMGFHEIVFAREDRAADLIARGLAVEIETSAQP